MHNCDFPFYLSCSIYVWFAHWDNSSRLCKVTSTMIVPVAVFCNALLANSVSKVKRKIWKLEYVFPYECLWGETLRTGVH